MMCIKCGEIMEHGVKEEKIMYKGKSCKYPQPGWYCKKCGDGCFSYNDIQSTDKIIIEFKRKVDEGS